MVLVSENNRAMSVIGLLVTSIPLLLLVFSSSIVVQADRTFTKVYEPIEGTVACFKRLNGTHEIGCRSSSSGDVGVLHLIEDKPSLDWVLKNGPHSPYIAVMYPEFFTRDNIIQFKHTKRVTGVLLLVEKERNTTSVSAFSTDSSCPNHGFGSYNTSSPKYCKKWNAPGTDLLFENLNFPIFYIKNETEAEKILKCYDTFNRPVNQTARPWPLCASQLKSFMMAAVDTPTCIRRSSAFSINPGTAKVCDPLGDQNLWASLSPSNSSEPIPDESVVVIGARLDGASLFDEMTPSADSTFSAVVTLLAVMKHLGAIKDQLTFSSTIKNVYFMFFNGEAFGYIGSSRIVYDMQRNQFPLNISQIRYFIEVNQAALRNPGESYFLHQSHLSQSKELTDIIEDQARAVNLSIRTVSNQQDEWGTPPSSLQSFLREKPDITGLVITNHETNYRNKFYNSIFDDKFKMEYVYKDRSVYSVQQKMASLAATIANSVIKLIDEKDPLLLVKPDIETVDELLHCYLDSANCTIFNQVTGVSQSPVALPAMQAYVGVTTYINTLTQYTKQVMIFYLGDKLENITKEEDCRKLHNSWMNNTCWENSLVNMTEAKSPAFLIPNYDWSSGKYSTWSESVWQKFSVRIFIKPSLFHEIMTLVSGILMAIVSFLVVRTVNNKADILFQSRYTGYTPVPPE